MNTQSNKSPAVEELTERLIPFFSVYDVQQYGSNIYFIGIPRAETPDVFQNLWAIFAERGFNFSYKKELGEHILIASPLVRERHWINVILLIVTIFTTMVMGSILFGVDPTVNPGDILKGIPFTIAIMTVLGTHESAHYIVAKKHRMHTSLPYFIPFPSMIGTMGAVIKHRGPIPDRKALFDVGVSGPLVGLFVSIIVTTVGLLQPPLPVVQTDNQFQILLSPPLLFELITRFIPAKENSPIHPVAFAGWVGMLVTALNLIPAGQLDGGHVLRAMLGEKASYVSKALPFVLFFLGSYMTFIMKLDGSIWIFWGILLLFFVSMGHPKPVNDEIPIGKGRMILGIITFILGLLCVTLIPFQIQ